MIRTNDQDKIQQTHWQKLAYAVDFKEIYNYRNQKHRRDQHLSNCKPSYYIDTNGKEWVMI